MFSGVPQPGRGTHGFLRDDPSFATGKRSFRLIDCCKDFGAYALTLFPQEKGFLHRLFLAQQPSAFDSLAGKASVKRAAGAPIGREASPTLPGDAQQRHRLPRQVEGQSYLSVRCGMPFGRGQ
jgi:hypothetical protein